MHQATCTYHLFGIEEHHSWINFNPESTKTKIGPTFHVMNISQGQFTDLRNVSGSDVSSEVSPWGLLAFTPGLKVVSDKKKYVYN